MNAIGIPTPPSRHRTEGTPAITQTKPLSPPLTEACNVDFDEKEVDDTETISRGNVEADTGLPNYRKAQRAVAPDPCIVRPKRLGGW